MVTLKEQIAEVKRELAMREVVYKKQIVTGKLNRSDANQQYLALKSVLKTLLKLHEKESNQTHIDFDRCGKKLPK